MVQRIFVKVVGFTGVERHALNSVFRLSRDAAAGRETCYMVWEPSAPEPARLALIDGASAEASDALHALASEPALSVIWVGAISPANAWRTFQRPLRWPLVLGAMDELFAGPPSVIDFDVASGDTAFDASQPDGHSANSKRALVADPDREARLYMRGKLASVGLSDVDEVASVFEAQSLLARGRYDFVSVDLGLNDLDPWLAIAAASKASGMVLVTGERIGTTTKMRAWFGDCRASMQKPLHPGELRGLLEKI